MKKIILYVLLIVMLVTFSGCVADTSPDYVNSFEQQEEFAYKLPEWVTWTMKEGEVRQHIDKDETIHEYGDLIYFTHPYENYYKDCRVTEYYGFTNENALIHMSYSFSYSNLNDDPNPYYEIYTEFKEKLTEIYGEPAGETEEWINERYKDDEYMRYKAIEDGDYTSMVAWDLEDCICYVKINKRVEIVYEAKKK